MRAVDPRVRYEYTGNDPVTTAPSHQPTASNVVRRLHLARISH